MAIKTFTCSICGKEGLTRRKTYALKDGTRACREHGQAQQDFQQREKEDAKKKADEKYKEEQKFKRRDHWHKMNSDAQYFDEYMQWPRNHCWTCGAEGISAQVFCVRVLIEKKRLQLHPLNQVIQCVKDDIDAFQKALKKIHETTETVLDYFKVKDMKQVLNRTKYRMRPIVQMMGYTQVCTRCSPKLKISKEMQFETLDEMMDAAEVAKTLMEPAVTAAAMKEIRNEVENN